MQTTEASEQGQTGICLKINGDEQPRSTRQWRDRSLAEDLRDRLIHDVRTSHLNLTLWVDGGVAHVQGEVASESERQTVRTLLRQQAGLYAAWDLLSLPEESLAVIDVGSGGKKQIPYAVSLDCFPLPGVDVVTDLEGPLPFADNTFNHVFAIHVLEHIKDLLGVMAELHRILKPTGVLHILAPHWQHPNAVADPTHCRFIDVQTFKYFCTPHPLVQLWRPLSVTASDDTVHADLQPIKTEIAPTPAELARWFQ